MNAPKYPEADKVDKFGIDNMRLLGEFITWLLDENDWSLCEFLEAHYIFNDQELQAQYAAIDEHDEDAKAKFRQKHMKPFGNEAEYIPAGRYDVRLKPDELVHRFIGVDSAAYEKEKQQMLKQLVEKAREIAEKTEG